MVATVTACGDDFSVVDLKRHRVIVDLDRYRAIPSRPGRRGSQSGEPMGSDSNGSAATGQGNYCWRGASRATSSELLRRPTRAWDQGVAGSCKELWRLISARFENYMNSPGLVR